jgi:glycosyltransferase involved in cell wall biosynthesis
MKPNPKLTIIFLSCNRTAYIREALEGIRAQACTDWKMIASDCSAKPESRAAIRQMVEEFKASMPDHDIEIIQQPKIIPEGEHMRCTLAKVTTPYIALLHDDDVWLPDHLRRGAEWLDQNPRHGLSMSNGIVIDDKSVRQGWTNSREDPLPLGRQGWFRLLMGSFFGSASGYIFRHEAIVHHTFYPVAVVDIDMALRVLRNGYEITGFTEATYLYRIHQASSYLKGEQVVRDRHAWRLWLFRREGLSIVLQCPVFFLLVVKSAMAKISYAFRGVSSSPTS